MHTKPYYRNEYFDDRAGRRVFSLHQRLWSREEAALNSIHMENARFRTLYRLKITPKTQPVENAKGRNPERLKI